MTRIIASAVALVVAASGCTTATVDSIGTVPPAAGAPATAAFLPVGTDLQVELNQSLSTADSRVGDRFSATVTRPIVATNGEVAVPRGAIVHGVVTGLDSSSGIGDQAAIRLAFQTLQVGSRTYPFSAAIVDTDVEVERNGTEAARAAALGAGAGAVLGTILTGDLEGILGGAILGAATGTIISLGVGEVEAALPAGSDMTIRSTQAVQLR